MTLKSINDCYLQTQCSPNFHIAMSEILTLDYIVKGSTLRDAPIFDSG